VELNPEAGPAWVAFFIGPGTVVRVVAMTESSHYL
jgi:hypothetical protein